MEGKNTYLKPTLLGTFWVYVSLYSGRFVNLIGLMILARLLLKEDFGVAGYATVVLSFIDFPGLGVGSALVYLPKDPRRTNTAFWLTLVIGAVMTAVMYFAAPLAGLYFKDERAVPVVQAFSIYFMLVAVGVIPSSLLTKNLSFRKKFFTDLAGDIGKAVVGISMALLGYGAFSLIAGNLIGVLMSTIALWIIWQSGWRPSLRFDTEFVRPILSYGFSIISLHTLGVIINNADYLIVGRYLGATALGAYMLAFRIPELVIKQLFAALSQVLFPVFSRMQEETGKVSEGFLNTMRYTSMLTVPMAIGLSLVADPLVRTLFGEKWLDAIPVTSAIAIYTLVRSLYFVSGDIFKAQGRPEIVTKLHLFNLVVLIPALYWAAVTYQSLVAVAWVQVAVVFFVGAVRIGGVLQLLKVQLSDFVKVLTPTVTASAIMAVAVQAILMLTAGAAPIARLALSIAVGAVSYSLAIFWLQRDVVLKARQAMQAVLSRA